VHDPRLMLPIPKTIHNALHNGPNYNKIWIAWLKENPTANAQDVLNMGKQMIQNSPAADYLLGYF
jgi:hypothetical protein